MKLKGIRQSVLILVITLLANSYVFGQEVSNDNRSAFRISRSKTQYLYFAKGEICDHSESGTKLIFNQSDYEVGVDSPKLYLGIFYFNAGINFVTLTQDEQEVCTFSSTVATVVPEKAFLHTREMLLTLGAEYGFLSFDASFGQMGVKGNYYLNNIRYDTEDTFLFLKLNSAIQFSLFSWGKYGVELSIAANPPRGDYTDGYINYDKASVFIKILL